MRRLRLILLWRVLVWSAVLLLALWAYGWIRQRPQDLPWTDLDLGQPVGLFTGRKLAALTGDSARCQALLDRAGIAYVAMKPGGAAQCAYADAVRLQAERGTIALVPDAVAPSCPVVAALKLWEWQVVQPAALRLYGQPVRTIRHLGSYSCRRLYGRSQGNYSEHATADAIDIAAFILKDGRQVSVREDWVGKGRDAAFLRMVRDGACGLFSTVLSPDYNAAHRDHFHLDQAERGATGWRACR
ncbi:extensin family protein [Sphingobium sp. HBC34]|uniref:Extensin family protein n=1 Tax=Sphingobium cyanobacteriorum TaxID=3063954 RepID=A0ABT8ZJG5_9SPHN|nr:extensin family protein [Sphingobium sp. HBC34]MDO7834664.1 extensin family protein [Sphingobium sp. HBC34]